ncbi:hypothetical protein GUJ93_ZPchr0013g37872 [Zizania palustris]|uniref:DUF7597 domain-containing protein n=1 Tax=Zizania palustris TaxID=103762 RepID=A0A8J5X201_ZIZPA|nr:hypothetical protein GUJ93_ZPchr0013g37872 [Zizania palustris]
MANFPANPLPFLPYGGVIRDGGGPLRRQRNFIALSGDLIKRHETFAIADHDGPLTPAQRIDLLIAIQHHLGVELRLQVARYCLHPLGVGLYKLGSEFERDAIINSPPIFIQGRLVRFVKHDEALNCKQSPFARAGWVMFLGYPLDCKTLPFLQQVCASFGQLLFWHEADPSLARVLVKVLYKDDLDVPRSITVKHGDELDGSGRSWTFPVYLILSDLADQGPGDKVPPPPDNGNPHPFLGEVLLGEPEWIQHWADNQLFGPMANQWHAHNQQQNQDNNQHDDEEEDPPFKDVFEPMIEDIMEGDPLAAEEPQDSMEISGISSEPYVDSHFDQPLQSQARIPSPVSSRSISRPQALVHQLHLSLVLAPADPSTIPQPIQEDIQDVPPPPQRANLPVRFVYSRRRAGGARRDGGPLLSAPPGRPPSACCLTRSEVCAEVLDSRRRAEGSARLPAGSMALSSPTSLPSMNTLKSPGLPLLVPLSPSSKFIIQWCTSMA